MSGQELQSLVELTVMDESIGGPTGECKGDAIAITQVGGDHITNRIGKFDEKFGFRRLLDGWLDCSKICWSTPHCFVG